MGDKTCRYPVAIRWDQGPKELKKVKNKLLLYFQKRSESNGGDCEIRDTDCSRGYILIHFKEQEAQKSVLLKSSHLIIFKDGTRFQDKKSSLLLYVSSPDAVDMGGAVSSFLGSGDDGASGSLVDKDYQQENNQYSDIQSRENSSRTDFGSENGVPKRSADGSIRHREREENRSDGGIDRNEQDNNSSAPKLLRENGEKSPEYPFTPGNEHRRNSLRRSMSIEEPARNRPASHPEDNGISGSSADTAKKGVVNKNPLHPKLKDKTRLPRVSLPDAANKQSMGYAASLRDSSIKQLEQSLALLNQSLKDNGTSGSSADTALFGTVTNPSLGVHEMRIGSVTFQVKTGDITKEDTEVIVNSSNRDFTLRTGVSKAILEAAGPPIASSAAALGSRPHKGYVITGSGKLRQCIWILHVIGPIDPTSTKKIVLDALQECENLQASSVTFPALGTGAGRLATSTVADSILDGLVDFIKSKSVRSLQTVKVVLFQQSMLNDFYMSMKKREKTAPEAKSLFTGLSDGESLRLPSHWKPMDKTLVMEVDVPPGTPEYSAVQQKFQKSCSKQILKILLVQNSHLWLNYQIKKQNIDSKNGSTTNERELFHGTDFDSIQHVNHNGFNRSYAGKHAAVYGNGTYFAVNANYSASDAYSKPDGNGQKHMYLARVLTGLYCVGQTSMKTPPAKNTAKPTDLYDSVTDNVQNPSMFVIFHDIQAYPEYHIIFQ